MDANDASQCIAGFPHGETEEGPGPANDMISKCIRSWWKEHGHLPLILPWQLESHFETWGQRVDHVIRKHREPGKYLDIHEVGYQAAAFMNKNGWTRCVVAAHEDSIDLCVKVMKKFDKRVVDTIHTNVYTPRSIGLWTRRPLLFKSYIAFETLLYKQRGWI